MQFVRLLATDASFRDAFMEYLDSRIAAENVLDRVDAGHSVDFQRGRVTELRSLKTMTQGLEHRKDDTNGPVQKG